MTALLGLMLALIGGIGSVTGLSVIPADDRTEVVVDVQGEVSITDFTLENPHRLVLDIAGARHGLQQNRFPVDRGGIRVVRTSQFQPNVVRVVLELSAPTRYQVQKGSDEIRISFPNPAGSFERWSSRGATRAPAATAAATPQTPSGPALVGRPVTEVDPERHPGTGERREARAQQPTAQRPRGATDRGEEPPPPPQEVTPSGVRATPVRDQQPLAFARTLSEPPARDPQPRINMFFKDTPVLEVLATFSEFSGRSIVAGADVSGTITADIRNQPWDLALHEILYAHGLAARETESGIIRVESMRTIRAREKEAQEAEEWADLVTQQFRIRYVSVDSILPAVQGLLGDRGQVTRNRSTNTLVVSGRRSVLERISPLIQELDVRTPQVSIAARIVFIDRSQLDEYGITYDLKDMRTPGTRINTFIRPVNDPDAEMVVNLGGSSIAALADANRPMPKSTLQVVASLVLGRHTLVGFLEALREVSMSEIQASPLIRTMSHREAYVLVGERTPVRVIDIGGAASQQQGQQPRATVDIQETGIILRATPHVTGDQILLELHAENSRPALAPSDLGFTFQTQESRTQVLLNDGETAVISGLTVVERARVHSGIPILMDVPVFGALFRGSRTQETKKDLLIMVTPHIVRDAEE